MKKMNNTGFMMAEVVVVSAVIIVTLVALYTSYNKIFSLYNQRTDYYNITTLYDLAVIRDNFLYGDNTSLEPFVYQGVEFNKDPKLAERTLYYINKDDIDNVKVDNVKSTFKNYISYLSSSVDFSKKINTNYDWDEMLIMEKCFSEDDCSYAYLEIPYMRK